MEVNILKATISHDNITNTMYFRVGNFNLIYTTPDKLKLITEISDYDDGFITMQTNYGEEYTDLIDLIDNSIFTDSYKKNIKKLLNVLKLSDIKLERG